MQDKIVVFKCVISIVSLGLIFLPGCRSDTIAGQTNKKELVADTSTLVVLTPEQFENAEIGFGNLKREKISEILYVDGMIRMPPESRISVTFPYGGIVREINVREGEFVRRGKILATLENPEFVDLQEEYLKSKSALDYARLELERQEKLYQADVAAGKSFQKAKSEYEQLHATVRASEQKLKLIDIDFETLTPEKIQSRIYIYALDDGYVTVVSANRGKYVASQEELLQLISMKNTYLDLTVFERDLQSVKIGQKVKYFISGDESKEETAQISIIGSEVRSDRTVAVHAIPDKRNIRLVSGAFVHAVIHQDGIFSDVLPADAVVRFRGGKYIFVRTDDYSFRMIPVQTITENETSVEVVFPFDKPPADAQIVLKGAFTLLGVLKNVNDEN